MKHERIIRIVVVVFFLFCILIVASGVMISKEDKNKTKPDETPKIKIINNFDKGNTPFIQEENKEEPLEEHQLDELYTTMYSTCRLNLRTNTNTESEIYTTVDVNTELKILDGFVDHGWKSVLYDNEKLFVYGEYLSYEKVEIKPQNKPVSSYINRGTKSSSNNNLIGTFKITHYAGDTTTSTGVIPTVGRTIAVDPNVIPYGSKVVINGHTYIAEDCGGAIKGNKIDIFVGSEEEAYQKGVYHTEVYWG